MAKPKTIQAGFRCDPEIYEEIKKIAEEEQRSIGQVLNLFVLHQVKRYQKRGWPAIVESDNEQSRIDSSSS